MWATGHKAPASDIAPAADEGTLTATIWILSDRCARRSSGTLVTEGNRTLLNCDSWLTGDDGLWPQRR